MDATIKSHMDAWAERLLTLAATDPQTYIETRYETDFWWSQWFMDHRDQLGALEDRIELAVTQTILATMTRLVEENPERRNYPMDSLDLPPLARRLAPDAKTVGDWIDAILPWTSDQAMQLLMRPEGAQ